VAPFWLLIAKDTFFFGKFSFLLADLEFLGDFMSLGQDIRKP
jgi:hypothetical protein